MSSGKILPSAIVVSLLLFGFFITSIFTVFSGVLSHNNITVDREPYANITVFQADLESFKDEVVNETLEPPKKTWYTEVKDVFFRGIDIITVIGKSPTTADKALSAIEEEEGFNMIPKSFWILIGGIVVIYIMFAIGSAYLGRDI